MGAATLIKTWAKRFGVELRRYNLLNSDELRFGFMLAERKVNLVLDVGANTGQFGELLRHIGYRGRIVSFEPLRAARAHLQKRAASDPLWELAPQAAIGAEEGEIDLHVAGNSVSSSVLQMLDSHTSVAPESSYVAVERVPIKRLDTLAMPYLTPDSTLFLKVDTQGYERQVLKGSPQLLARAVGCQLEMSFAPLYEGQVEYQQLLAEMLNAGMELWDLAPVLVDPSTGRLLQVDATFMRKCSTVGSGAAFGK